MTKAGDKSAFPAGPENDHKARQKRLDKLQELWRDRGSEDEFSPAEEILLRAVVTHGGVATIARIADVTPAEYFRSLDAMSLSKYMIRAKLVRWLCGDAQAQRFVASTGIVIVGAMIVNVVSTPSDSAAAKVVPSGMDLSNIDARVPLDFRRCFIPGGIRLTSAKVKTSFFRGCDTGAILASGVHVDGSLMFDRYRVPDGQEDLSDPPPEHLCAGPEASMSADSDLYATRIRGGINLYGAHVSRDVNFVGTKVVAIGALDRIQQEGSSAADGALTSSMDWSEDTWSPVGMKGGVFERYKFSRDTAVNLDNLRAKSVYLRFRFEAYGEVRLTTAEIEGDLHAENSVFLCTTKERADRAIDARGLRVGGNAYLCCESKFIGGIDLSVASVSGNLYLGSATIVSPAWRDISRLTKERGTPRPQVAVLADGLRVDGDFDIRAPRQFQDVLGTPVRGIACLIDDGEVGKIEEHVRAQCKLVLRRNGWEEPDAPPSLICLGTISLIGARIRGSFDAMGAWIAVPENHGEHGLRLGRARIDGVLFLNGYYKDRHENALMAPFATDGVVELTHCRVGTLFDSPASWPRPGKLEIDGFLFEDFVEYVPGTASVPPTPGDRLRWLKRQRHWTDTLRASSTAKVTHNPEPFVRVARYLRQKGYDEAWRSVAIENARRRFHAEVADLWHSSGFFAKVRSLFLRFAIWPIAWVACYGQSSRRAGVGLIVLIFLSTTVFTVARKADPTLITPTQSFLYANNQQSHQSHQSHQSQESQESKENKESHHWPREYPGFSPFLYAVDSALPIINLHQEVFWSPASEQGSPLLGSVADRAGEAASTLEPKWFGEWLREICVVTWGQLLEFYLAIHIVSGWLLSTVILVNLTGVLRREDESDEE